MKALIGILLLVLFCAGIAEAGRRIGDGSRACASTGNQDASVDALVPVPPDGGFIDAAPADASDSGHFDQAFAQLDSTDDAGTEFVNVPDNAFIRPSATQMTVACWTRYSNACATAQIVGQWTTTSPTQNSWRAQTIASGAECQLRVAIASSGSDTGANRKTTGDFFVDGVPMVWTWWAFTYNAGALEIYRYGLPFASTLAGTIPTSIRDSTNDMTFGANDDLTQPGKIGIDECYGWGIALTPGEVQAIYNRGLPDDPANLIAAPIDWGYRFEAGEHPNVLDFSGNGQTGTYENMEGDGTDTGVTSPMPPPA